jgi:Protein of unknown function (DUF2442)
MSARKVVRITEVEPKTGRRLALTFDDGARGVADVSQLLVGPVFEEIRQSDKAFALVALDGYGSIAWPNGADLDPRVLRELTVSETTAS